MDKKKYLLIYGNNKSQLMYFKLNKYNLHLIFNLRFPTVKFIPNIIIKMSSFHIMSNLESLNIPYKRKIQKLNKTLVYLSG